MSNNSTNWNHITNEEAFRLSQAEFKGMTMQALKDIRADINQLQNYNNNTRYISMILAGIAGIVSGFFGSSIQK